MSLSLWTCPHCHQPLRRIEREYGCAGGHVFDQAREGYVNLLPVHRTHSAQPGDDKRMLRSRRAFLEQGFYQNLATQLTRLVSQLAQQPAPSSHAQSSRDTDAGTAPFTLLDTGCGEGYYTGQIADALHHAVSAPRVGGIDIAKEAVRMAAGRHADIEFAVASTASLPVADASVDTVLRIFAPGDDAEVCRVLRPGGHFISVTPGPRHLHALRQLIYAHPREHDAHVHTIDGLIHVQRAALDDEITVTGRDTVAQLLTMTPYYWQADEATQRTITQRETLHTDIAFRIDVYQRATA